MGAEELDPQVVALLERFARAGVRPVSEQTPAAARRAGLALADALDQEAGSTAIIRHLNRVGQDGPAGIAAAVGLPDHAVAARLESLHAAGVVLRRPDGAGGERWSVRIGGRRRARSAGGVLDRLDDAFADDAPTATSDEPDGVALPGGVRDIVLAPDVEMRVYRPDAPAGTRLPAVVFIHGGGWVIGSIATYDPVCRRVMDGTGAIVISLGYRLAPEHPYPAAIDDVERLWREVLARADRLGIDTDRIAVMGDSVGGGLATVLALRARDVGWGSVAAQVLAYPVTDATRALPSYARHADAPLLSRADMEWFYGHYAPPPGDWRASPLHAPDLAGLPPALVVLAPIDPVRDDGAGYAERLAAAGVPVTVDEQPGMIHGFLQLAPALDGATAAHARIAAWLRAQLGIDR
ncbi:MAG: alpha/beta hydrolase fold domain-containing protein [Chloroflexota bacterium]